MCTSRTTRRPSVSQNSERSQPGYSSLTPPLGTSAVRWCDLRQQWQPQAHRQRLRSEHGQLGKSLAHTRASTDTPLHCALQYGNDVFFTHNSPNTAVLDGNEFATPSGAVYKWPGKSGSIDSGGSCPANRADVSMCSTMTIDGSPGAGDTMYNCQPCPTCSAGQEGTVESRIDNARE